MNIEIEPLQGRFDIEFDEWKEEFFFRVTPFDTIRKMSENSVGYWMRKLEEMRKPKKLGFNVDERKIQALIEKIEGMVEEGFEWTNW